MITPEEFPYITSIYVNDCYAYQHFNIDLVKHQPFSHLILTGKNGSGKSTILREIDRHIKDAFEGIYLSKDIGITKTTLKKADEYLNSTNRDSIEFAGMRSFILNSYDKSLIFFKEEGKIQPYTASEITSLKELRKTSIYSFLSANRNSKISNKVETPTKQEDIEKQLELEFKPAEFFIQNFKQYLVNKKVSQAFAQIDNNEEEVERISAFFRNIEIVFRNVFEDNDLKIVFEKDSYEIIIRVSDNRNLTFDTLPDGLSAIVSILMDLYFRLDLIRKNVGNFNFDPCGIVLIDEPETHLHLSLQYQVLPILTKLFPNVQFIVATHSPAVISSIKNVTVFDLTSKETLSDEAVGKSFSELMVSHFGLDNEFSSLTDEIFDEFNTVLRENRKNIPLRNEKLKELMSKHERYISPTMRFELEAKLSESL